MRTRIFAAAGLLGTFLSNYGSIRQGAEYLATDVMDASRAVAHKVTEVAGVKPKDVIRTMRSATLTRRIRNVVDQVESGSLSADSGAKRIVALLNPDHHAALSQELLRSIQAEVEAIHYHILPQATSALDPIPAAIIEEYAPKALATNEEAQTSETPNKPRRIRVFRDQDGRGRVRVVEE